MKNDDTNNSLNNTDNYKKSIDSSVANVGEKYAYLMLEYYKFIYDNIHLKNSNHSKYIIIRGLDTLTNVFLNILSATKNLELTYFHCQKAYYFYVEFVGQISDDEKSFLQLTSRDATTYVYKKSVFEICESYKKPNDADHNDKCKKIGHIVNIFQTYLLKIIHSTNSTKNEENLNLINTACSKVIGAVNKINLYDLENITEKLYNKVEDITTFFNLSIQIIKKINKGSDYIKLIEKKMESDEFNSKLDDLESYLLN